MAEQSLTPVRNGSSESVAIEPNGVGPSDEDTFTKRRQLIRLLPGKYRLISSEEYLREKHGETAREDR